MERTRRALILGATGGVGGETARALARHGWHLRALTRRDGGLPDLGAVEWRRGDALNPADVIAAAEGCDVILHAVNPPGYRDWAGTVLPMLDATLAAARRHGARGGKLLGAGGGGFLLLIAPPWRHRSIREALGRPRGLDFRIARHGSQNIFIGDVRDGRSPAMFDAGASAA